MLSTTERKKLGLAKGFGSDKKYDEIYQQFAVGGYSKELCESFADTFVNNVKKPSASHIIQLAILYEKIFDYKRSDYYLELLSDKRLSADEKYHYCMHKLRSISLVGNWRDAEDFRTENIDFIQTYMEKKKLLNDDVDMHTALALVDCAAKRFAYSFKTLNFGYKPKGRNDEQLLRMFIAVVYIYYKSGDAEGLEQAKINAISCLKLFNEFKFSWSKDHYAMLIENAANGIL